MSVTAEATAIRPFRIEVPEEQLADLRRRIEATRWPSKELVADRSQGVQLATLQALARYWTTEYDWRRCEARLNALPQFTTEIDGVEIHFIHVRSRHENALPLIMTHGWPGSVIELLDTVGPLTDPTAHGGTPEDAFHLVLPSLPGYGFSGEPTELGWESGRIARAWAELMDRLGYTRYVAQGGDVGADVTDAMGRQGPEGLVGIHVNLLGGGARHQGPTAGGVRAGTRGARRRSTRSRRTASATSWSSPPGRRRSATRCWTHPIGLAAWMLDHDTDSYYKISRAFVDGEPVGNLTRETIVDNITLYWLTGTGASAARWYWEFGRFLAAARRPARLPRRSRFRSASRRSPARSGLPRAAGSRRSIPASRTSTRSTGAATSPPGRSRSSSPPRCGLHSAHCAERRPPDREPAQPRRGLARRLALRRDGRRHPRARVPAGTASGSPGHALRGRARRPQRRPGAPRRGRHGQDGAAAVRRAAGLRFPCAQIAGVEAEMELPFAGMHQLCAPMLDRLDALPAPQREASQVALGLATGNPPDRFLVSLAGAQLAVGRSRGAPAAVRGG